jgi:hypothetical protein
VNILITKLDQTLWVCRTPRNHYFTVQMQHPARPGSLMKIINVLRDDIHFETLL